MTSCVTTYDVFLSIPCTKSDASACCNATHYTFPTIPWPYGCLSCWCNLQLCLVLQLIVPYVCYKLLALLFSICNFMCFIIAIKYKSHSLNQATFIVYNPVAQDVNIFIFKEIQKLLVFPSDDHHAKLEPRSKPLGRQSYS